MALAGAPRRGYCNSVSAAPSRALHLATLPPRLRLLSSFLLRLSAIRSFHPLFLSRERTVRSVLLASASSDELAINFN